MKHYDLCIIGGGPAGFAAAMRGIDLEKRVVLIEKERLGGAGIQNGALSSKTFWEIAQSYAAACHLAQDCETRLPLIPFHAVKKRVKEAVDQARGLMELMIESANDQHTHGHIDLVYGKGEIRGPHEVAVSLADSLIHISADNIILATGSHPRHLPDVHIDEKRIFSSDGIENLEDYPKSMVVLGAGVIGCEFATIFALLGGTEVFLIDKADRILPFEDADVVEVVEEKLEKHGVHVHRNAKLVYMKALEDGVEYCLAFSDGQQSIFKVDIALVSVGRVPTIQGLGVENAGLKVTDKGHLEDPHKDTTTHCPSIYAVGDLTADIALVNVAELEGRFAVERMYGVATRPLCYDNISTIMFLHPEVAGVGLNEIEAQKQGIPYIAASVDYKSIPRAIAMHATDGFVKLLVNPQDYTLIGMRTLGEHASSTIQAVALMIRDQLNIRDLADLIHPHPSITEGVQECARAILGTHIRKCSHVRVWHWKP